MNKPQRATPALSLLAALLACLAVAPAARAGTPGETEAPTVQATTVVPASTALPVTTVVPAGENVPTAADPAAAQPGASDAGSEAGAGAPGGTMPAIGAAGEAVQAQLQPTEVPQAVQEAIGQASVQPVEAPSGSATTLAAESSATTQLIWQVQISQCVANCYGIQQHQSAGEQAATRQAILGEGASGGAGAAQSIDERAQVSGSVTQIQIGCQAHCFGTTTAAGTPPSAYSRVIEELLNQITSALFGVTAAPAVQQSTLSQMTYQSQVAAEGQLAQTQSASLVSATGQSYATALQGQLGAGRDGRAVAEEAVSTTEQGIWQLQIGCLILCHETSQYQEALQSTWAQQTLSTSRGSEAGAGAAASDAVAQVIWQAQVGCLLWCFDATQQQRAGTANELAGPPGAGAQGPAEPPAAPGASSHGTPVPGPSAAEASAAAQAAPPGGGAGPLVSFVPASPRDRLQTMRKRHLGENAAPIAGRPLSARAHVQQDRPPAGAIVKRPGRSFAPEVRNRRAANLTLRTSRARAAITPGAGASAHASSATWLSGEALLAVVALCAMCCLPLLLTHLRRRSQTGHTTG